MRNDREFIGVLLERKKLLMKEVELLDGLIEFCEGKGGDVNEDGVSIGVKDSVVKDRVIATIDYRGCVLEVLGRFRNLSYLDISKKVKGKFVGVDLDVIQRGVSSALSRLYGSEKVDRVKMSDGLYYYSLA